MIPNYYFLVATYLLMTLCYYYILCVNEQNYKFAFVLGLLVYGTFDLTNLCLF